MRRTGPPNTPNESDPMLAWERAAEVADEYARHLSLSLGRNVTAEGIAITHPDGRMTRAPWHIDLMHLTTYDLGGLRAAIGDAAGYGGLRDERMRRSLDYYDLAVLLFERRGAVARPATRQHRELIAAVFLNLWKAVTTIVGDPSADRDHQSRYRALGLDDEFFKARIGGLSRLRDKYDVAHYSLDRESLRHLEAEFDQAKQTAEEVLRRYRASLLA